MSLKQFKPEKVLNSCGDDESNLIFNMASKRQSQPGLNMAAPVLTTQEIAAKHDSAV